MTSSKAKPDIIIYGGPGSGKSTQAEILVKKLAARHLNMGELLRVVVDKKRAGWRDVKHYMNKGGLVPERITSWLVSDFVAATPRSQRIVFDGYPRRLLQIKLLQKMERQFGRSVVMVLVGLPTLVAKRRIINRARLEGRIDDIDPQTISQRIRVFRERSKEVVKYYQKQGTLIKVNGDQTIPAVARDIWKALSKL